MGSAADDELLAAATVAKSSRQMLAVGDLVKVTDGDLKNLMGKVHSVPLTTTLTPTLTTHHSPLTVHPNPNPNRVLALHDLPLRAQEGAEMPAGAAEHSRAALHGFDAESSCYDATLPDGSQAHVT